MKKVCILLTTVSLLLALTFSLTGCSVDEYYSALTAGSENSEPSKLVSESDTESEIDAESESDTNSTTDSVPTKLVYVMYSKSNHSYVELDLEKQTVTIYNTISGHKGTTHTAIYSGTYPNTIEAYFKEFDVTKSFTFGDDSLTETDSRGYVHTFKLFSKE